MEKCAAPCVKEAVCVHTRKVYDSCRDKDCGEDLRVYLTRESQEVLDGATGVKGRRAQLLWVYSDVEPVNFHRGFYTIDLRYYYRITAEAFCGARPEGMARPQTVTGLAFYHKRVMLYGSEGSARVFSSDRRPDTPAGESLPTAVVEAVDPILLGIRIAPGGIQPREEEPADLPRELCEGFGGEPLCCEGANRLYVTLGQFSIIRLERESQLLMPAYDFSVPEKECVESTEESPCQLFERISFPTGEFFPPDFGVTQEWPGCNPGCACEG